MKWRIKATELPSLGLDSLADRANLAAGQALWSLTEEDEETGLGHFIGCR